MINSDSQFQFGYIYLEEDKTLMQKSNLAVSPAIQKGTVIKTLVVGFLPPSAGAQVEMLLKRQNIVDFSTIIDQEVFLEELIFSSLSGFDTNQAFKFKFNLVPEIENLIVVLTEDKFDLRVPTSFFVLFLKVFYEMLRKAGIKKNVLVTFVSCKLEWDFLKFTAMRVFTEEKHHHLFECKAKK